MSAAEKKPGSAAPPGFVCLSLSPSLAQAPVVAAVAAVARDRSPLPGSPIRPGTSASLVAAAVEAAAVAGEAAAAALLQLRSSAGIPPKRHCCAGRSGMFLHNLRRSSSCD